MVDIDVILTCKFEPRDFSEQEMSLGLYLSACLWERSCPTCEKTLSTPDPDSHKHLWAWLHRHSSRPLRVAARSSENSQRIQQEVVTVSFLHQGHWRHLCGTWSRSSGLTPHCLDCSRCLQSQQHRLITCLQRLHTKRSPPGNFQICSFLRCVNRSYHSADYNINSLQTVFPYE